MRSARRKGASAVVVFGGTFLAAGVAMAQGPGARPAPPPQPTQAAGGIAATQGVQPASTQIVPVPGDLIIGQPGGVTADQVGQRAAATSWSAKANEEQMRAAAARVDQAWSAFIPRVTGTARYTRLSDFNPPNLFPQSPYASVVTTQPTPAFDPTTGQPATPLDPKQAFAAPPINFAFPMYLDNYLLQANIVVPISDYFLRINQTYSSASHSEEAAKWDLVAARAKANADGKAAYYTWMRARANLIVATQSMNDARTHLQDARNQFTVGNASRADVLRAETQVAAAEFTVEQSKHLIDFAEKQVRVAMHIPDEQPLKPGEGIEAEPPTFQGNLPQLVAEAQDARPEVKSIEENAKATRKQASATRGAELPSISAFGDGIYANPNPRRFSPKAEWFPTWDVGIQAVWTPNDVLTQGSSARDFEHRASALEAQKQATRDGIAIEVAQAWQQIKDAEAQLESSRRQLASAQEAYRVARELFNNGRGTSTTLTDAETELARARFTAVNAAVDARIARVRLDHALGRDARVASAP